MTTREKVFMGTIGVVAALSVAALVQPSASKLARALDQKPPLVDVSMDVPGKGVTRLAFVPDGTLKYLGGTCFRLNAEAIACGVVLIAPHPPEDKAAAAAPAPAPQEPKK